MKKSIAFPGPYLLMIDTFLNRIHPKKRLMVTLRLADLEGMKAWHAEPDLPKFSIPHRVVVDHEGAPIKSMEG